MVSQENVTLIVTTCNVFEKGQPKCAQYWPTGTDDGPLKAALAKVGITVEVSGADVPLT